MLYFSQRTSRNKNIQKQKKLTLRKLFGVYFHDLTAHAGLSLRIVTGQNANAEEEERIFHHIKGITDKQLFQ